MTIWCLLFYCTANIYFSCFATSTRISVQCPIMVFHLQIFGDFRGSFIFLNLVYDNRKCFALSFSFIPWDLFYSPAIFILGEHSTHIWKESVFSTCWYSVLYECWLDRMVDNAFSPIKCNPRRIEGFLWFLVVPGFELRACAC
jgi:hypothetical protein